MAAPPPADRLLLVGRCYKPHGVKGEMKVIPESDDPERLLDLETLFVGHDPDNVQAMTVLGTRMQTTGRGPLVLIRFDGVHTPEQVQAFRHQLVFADADELPLEDDEFFLHELIGMAVVLTDGTPVGVLHDTMHLTAHDVYVVARDGRPDVMIPAVEEFVKEIDFDAQRIVIEPVEGLLE